MAVTGENSQNQNQNKKNKNLEVTAIYDEDGKTFEQLMEEAFRLITRDAAQ